MGKRTTCLTLGLLPGSQGQSMLAVALEENAFSYEQEIYIFDQALSSTQGWLEASYLAYPGLGFLHVSSRETSPC